MTVINYGNAGQAANALANNARAYGITPSEKLQAEQLPMSVLANMLAGNLDGVLNVKAFGAVGDGVTDDTAAIQAAIDAVEDADGGTVVFPAGQYRITSQIVVKVGVNLLGGNKTQGVIYRTTTEALEFEDGTFFYVDFGSGTTTVTNAAFMCRNRSSIVGFAFYYPTQAFDAATPTAFPPSIAMEVSSQGVVVEDCNFVNSYIAVDASRIHASLYVRNVVGFPIFRGIVTGSMVDNDYTAQVHFHPLYAFRGGTGAYEPWVAANGRAFSGGRCSWSVWESCFCYGYNIGFDFRTVAADAPNNVTAGAAENCHFTNCGVDGGALYGFSFEGACWGNVLTNCMGAMNDPQSTGAVTTAAFRYEPSGSIFARDITFIGCRVHGSRYRGFRVLAGVGVTFSGCHVVQYGTAAIASAFSISNCENTTFSACYVRGTQATAGSFGIQVAGSSENTTITGCRFDDITGRGVAIQDTASRYIVTSNTFVDGTLPGILDEVGNANSVIENNVDDQQVFALGDTDVTAGVLSLPANSALVAYGGTENITAISPARRNGRITIRFTSAITVTDSATLTLAGGVDFVTASGDVLNLMSDGTGWYEVSRTEA